MNGNGRNLKRELSNICALMDLNFVIPNYQKHLLHSTHDANKFSPALS